ncbi:SWIM zinc finger family protein [Methanocella sp. MCL-LM]|uniref:SWIM zinc finger family protein n=1 Tax=Methanocella sp. MCL-LM TaxID=3412035 RepID=UPI003C74F76C
MPDFTDDDLIDIFGDRSYERGLDYYHSGNVTDPLKINGVLYAEVWGSADEPYQTSVTIDEDGNIFSDCSCPVGDMCKHGVAVMLSWMHEPSSFMNGDKVIKSLESRSREELLETLKKLLYRHRGLIKEIGVCKASGKNADISVIVKRIGHAINPGREYYDGSVLVNKLEPIMEEAYALSHEGRRKDAAIVFLKLTDSCLDALQDGVDDEADEIGGLIVECSEAFSENVDTLEEEAKEELIDPVLTAIWKDDWSHGLEDMLSALITRKNIDTVRQRVLKNIEANHDIGHHRKDDIIKLLGDSYKSYGKPDEKVRLTEECLADKDDYARLATAKLESGDEAGAFVVVMRGFSEKEGRSVLLDDLYFDLALRLVDEKPELIDHRTSLIPALNVLSGWFDAKRYAGVSGLFRKIGKLDELHETMIKCIKNKDTVAQALIYDGNVNAAIKLAIDKPDLHPNVQFEIAKAAKNCGREDEAARIIRSFAVRKRHLWDRQLPSSELIELMISRSDMRTLKALCDQIISNKTADIAEKMLPGLARRYPELASSLLKEFFDRMPVQLIANAARLIGGEMPEQMIDICMSKIGRDCLKSHSYYDDAMLLLKAVRDICVQGSMEQKWASIIREFASKNKGKKKLIGMIEREFGDI